MNNLEGHLRSSKLQLFDRTIYDFLLVVCNNVSIVHRFRDITTFTVYVTASSCDL